MSEQLKLTEITLENFIGIYAGLGKKRLKLDLRKLINKDIIIILGDNGTGKSTLTSVLHPLPGTTDKRNKFIREDKDGLKIVKYEKGDVEYECKIVYTPSKTGHNSKAYLKKIVNGKTIELNPNGNVTSYKELLMSELGVSDAVLKLSSQNDVCKGHVDMTSTERKLNMSTFLPEDIYSHHYAVVDKTYKELKTRINILVDSIGKMHDDEFINDKIKEVTKDINELVAKRDKCVGKIKEFETRISIINEQDIEKRESSLNKEIKSYTKEIESIGDRIAEVYRNNLSSVIKADDSVSRINIVINEIKQSWQEDEISYQILLNKLENIKEKRNQLSEDISSKELLLQDIDNDYSLDELKVLCKQYKSRYDELEKTLSKLNSDVTKNDFINGYEIIDNIRTIIDRIRDYDSHLIEEVVSNFHNFESINNKLDTLYQKRNDIRIKRSELESKVYSLNENSELKDILNMRPKDCIIDTCPFIEKAMKWEIIEKRIIEYSNDIDNLSKDLDKLDKDIYKVEELVRIYNQIKNGWIYIDANIINVEKLPNNKIYSNLDSYLKCIMKPKLMEDADKHFDEFISVLECKDEFNEIKYKKIPSIENEIKILQTQGSLIETTRDTVRKMKSEYDDICKEIEETKNKIKIIKDKIDYSKEILEALSDFLDVKNQYKNLYDEISKSFTELEEVKAKIEELNEYKIKYKEKKEKLKEIDAKLNPLTNERELYKMEQLKVLDNKRELAAIEGDMYKCEIIRAALSIKDDGIPVDVLEYFMDNVRQNANTLLSRAFNGALYLEEFEINSKDFIIPYKKNGDRGIDVSYASTAERSFISLCLTLAIMEEIMSVYTICILDEIEGGFSDINKHKFIDILGSQIKRVGISQIFMITHNYNFYEGFDLGYIMFPGSSLTKFKENDVIRVYDE